MARGERNPMTEKEGKKVALSLIQVFGLGLISGLALADFFAQHGTVFNPMNYPKSCAAIAIFFVAISYLISRTRVEVKG